MILIRKSPISRDRKITEIIPTEEYSYGGVPVINGRGFEVKAESDTDVKQFLKEYSESNENSQKDFFEKWVRFDTYRKVVIQGEKK